VAGQSRFGATFRSTQPGLDTPDCPQLCSNDRVRKRFFACQFGTRLSDGPRTDRSKPNDSKDLQNIFTNGTRVATKGQALQLTANRALNVQFNPAMVWCGLFAGSDAFWDLVAFRARDIR